MLASMTGFGRASLSEGGVSYWLEIKSLNGKYFKLVCKLPDLFNCYETRIEQLLRSRLGRGSVFYALRIRDVSETAAWEVNPAAVRGYLHALQDITAGLAEGLEVRVDLGSILLLPGVCQMPEPDAAELERRWEVIGRLTETALAQVLAMREDEGRMLRADLETQCRAIRSSLDRVRERAPLVIRDYAERLRSRTNDLVRAVEAELRPEDLAREVAVFAERSDINEELARLDSHLQQFLLAVGGDADAGRKLEFLAQEMLRETNTVGAKANDAVIAQEVIAVKCAIDRIKEQLGNVV